MKGSFTGAYRDKPGKLETADGGTMFLDEVGEMTLRMQGLLLRFLETGELQKVGSERAGRRVDVRVVAATNRNLQDLIAQGQFREDLYYRLNVIHFWVPPLRERKDDIPEPHSIISCAASRATTAIWSRAIEPDAFQALCDYPWPGNVRELENVIERLIVTGRHEKVRLEDLPAEIRLQRGLVGLKPKRERRRTVADDLYKKLREDRESFWTAVYPLYMAREITRQNVRDVIRKGLEEAKGNYKIVCKLFNIESGDYKKFLNFLRKHDCQLPVQGVPSVSEASRHVRDLLRTARASVRSHDEPALPLPHAAASRGAEHAALRPLGAARPDDAARRCGDGQDDRAARRAQRGAPAREPPRPAHQPDADAVGVLRVHRPRLPPERRAAPSRRPAS